MFEKERNRGTEKDVNADAVQNAFRSCNEMGKSLYAENKMIRNDMKESNHSCYDSTIKFQTPEKATMFIRLKDGYGKVKIGPCEDEYNVRSAERCKYNPDSNHESDVTTCAENYTTVPQAGPA